MTAADRLLRLADALPEGGTVVLDANALRRLAGVETPGHVPGAATPEPLADLTCEEAAAELDRAASTIRTWCASGKVPGAYRLHAREWRLPRASLRRYLDSQREKAAGGDDASSADLGRWRRVRGQR